MLCRLHTNGVHRITVLGLVVVRPPALLAATLFFSFCKIWKSCKETSPNVLNISVYSRDTLLPNRNAGFLPARMGSKYQLLANSPIRVRNRILGIPWHALTTTEEIQDYDEGGDRDGTVCLNRNFEIRAFQPPHASNPRSTAYMDYKLWRLCLCRLTKCTE